MLGALATTVEVAADEGIEAGMMAGASQQALVCQGGPPSPPCNPGEIGASPWIPIEPWVCGDWEYETWSLDSYGCKSFCHYRRENHRTYERTLARWNPDCTTHTWRQRTVLKCTQTVICSKFDGLLPAASVNRPLCVTFSACPAAPYSGFPLQCGSGPESCEPGANDEVVPPKPPDFPYS